MGNQNCGKTTLFNCLTDSNQKIGNWPGVTVQKKTGIIKGTNYELTDLPGVYSLNPYTEEEKITRDFIFNNKPKVIINIIDATCLERSLYLTTQLLELNVRVIIALNMTDILEKKGIAIDAEQLQSDLGVQVCRISALKKNGIDELINCIKNKKKVEHVLVCDNCKTCFLKNNFEESITLRYKYIERIVKRCLHRKKKWVNSTEILDKIFLNKVFALPIFIIIMFLVYFLSVGVVGKNTINITNDIMQILSNKLNSLLIKIQLTEWIRSLIIDGAIKGMTSVLTFVPQLVILFTCINILETTGYMARVAFLMDNILKKIGLSGKAIIPFIVGTGCSVPGIMSSRIIENSDERKMIAILVPYIPCSAKLPIIALFSNYFFKDNSGIISTIIYFFSIFVIILSSIILRKFEFLNSKNEFILELPDYKLPNVKYVTRDVLEKTSAFIKRAGTTIFLCSIFIWFLLSFSTRLSYGVSVENSILASIGKKISWLFYPMIGKSSWQVAVSWVQGLIAKEQVISSMTIISGFENKEIFKSQAFDFFTPVSAFAFVIFNLFSAPCFATIATMKKELGGFRKMFISILFQTTLAWILATLIYQIYILIF